MKSQNKWNNYLKLETEFMKKLPLDKVLEQENFKLSANGDFYYKEVSQGGNKKTLQVTVMKDTFDRLYISTPGDVNAKDAIWLIKQSLPTNYSVFQMGREARNKANQYAKQFIPDEYKEFRLKNLQVIRWREQQEYREAIMLARSLDGKQFTIYDKFIDFKIDFMLKNIDLKSLLINNGYVEKKDNSGRVYYSKKFNSSTESKIRITAKKSIEEGSVYNQYERFTDIKLWYTGNALDFMKNYVARLKPNEVDWNDHKAVFNYAHKNLERFALWNVKNSDITQFLSQAEKQFGTIPLLYQFVQDAQAKVGIQSKLLNFNAKKTSEIIIHYAPNWLNSLGTERREKTAQILVREYIKPERFETIISHIFNAVEPNQITKIHISNDIAQLCEAKQLKDLIHKYGFETSVDQPLKVGNIVTKENTQVLQNEPLIIPIPSNPNSSILNQGIE